MNTDDIRLLYQYNAWANTRILNAASKISADQFLAPASFPHGGLRSTLTHILFAEWIWRMRWLGESPSRRIKAEEFPTFESLRTRWKEEEGLLMDYIHGLSNEALNKIFSYKSTEGESLQRVLWQAMAHVVNHGTQHRSEAAAMLTQLGQSPGDIDLIVYLREGS